MADHVLITGVPGARGARVLLEVLREERETRISLLVRSEDRANVETMLASLSPDPRRERVNVVEGDPAAMDLGLSGSEFRALAASVELIHHVAITNDSALERTAVERLNVGGAREILELAEACTRLRALIFHSSIASVGNREGFVGEDEPLPRDGFRNVIEESFARAERMMRAAMPKVPIVVARAGMTVGDSQTGEIDRLDGFYLLVLLIMTSPRDFALPLPSRGDAPLHLVPLDYVARASRVIGRDARAIGKTVHLVDRAPLPSRRVLEVVAQAAGRRMGRGFIPANLTKALLSAPGIDRIARSPRSLVDAMATRVSFATANADMLLEGTGITCPAFESYADGMVDYVRRRMDERRERRAASIVDHDPLV